MYFILNYLLSKQCFKEAKAISSYLWPGRIIDANDAYSSTKYYQIASLWYSEISKKLDKLVQSYRTEEALVDQELCSSIKHHLQILGLCDESLCYPFKFADVYVRKLAAVPLVIVFPYLLQIVKYLSAYITNLKKLSAMEAYGLMVSTLGYAFYKRNDVMDNISVLNYFQQCDSYLLESLKISSTCYNCYKLFRDFTLNLFDNNFMAKDFDEARFQKCFELLGILTQKYGVDNGALVETVFALTYSYDGIFGNWESLVSKQLANTNLSYDNIVKMGEFVKRAHAILKNRPFSATFLCKKCPEPAKCLVKRDIYNACVLTSLYIKVVAKLNADTFNDKAFSLTKELMEDFVSVFKELDGLGCKNSSPMWDMCGRTIFNIGLISEAKHPVELEKLYEVLCAQIVQHDGLGSRVSSFGLENPVGTALHRLSVSHFYQGELKLIKIIAHELYSEVNFNYSKG